MTDDKLADFRSCKENEITDYFKDFTKYGLFYKYDTHRSSSFCPLICFCSRSQMSYAVNCLGEGLSEKSAYENFATLFF